MANMVLSKELSDRCSREQHELLRANFFANLATTRAARGVKKLAGQLAGKTVAVAGAGPSLDECLPALKKWGGPVIASDRAVRPLLAAGIVPYFVVAVEISKLGARKLTGLRSSLKNVPLAFDPLVAPATLDSYPGPLYTWNRPKEVLDKGDIRLGTGVVTYAVGLAEIMAASQIVLVGVDLAYPGDRIHAAGVVDIPEEVIEGELYVKNVRGELVRTDPYLGCNLEELAKAAEDGLPLFQTSAIGAFIPGATHAPLEALL